MSTRNGLTVDTLDRAIKVSGGVLLAVAVLVAVVVAGFTILGSDAVSANAVATLVFGVLTAVLAVAIDRR